MYNFNIYNVSQRRCEVQSTFIVLTGSTSSTIYSDMLLVSQKVYAFNIHLCNYTVKSLCRYVHWGGFLVATSITNTIYFSYKITSVIIMRYVQINLRNGIPIIPASHAMFLSLSGEKREGINHQIKTYRVRVLSTSLF
jgi:hypothetical protein